jgi:uncharacterized protein (TIGR02246 family)
MNTGSTNPSTGYDAAARALHRTLIECRNGCDAAGFAACFADDGTLVGFGTTVAGRDALAVAHQRAAPQEQVRAAGRGDAPRWRGSRPARRGDLVAALDQSICAPSADGATDVMVDLEAGGGRRR